MSTLHQNILFAALDGDLHLERVAGGNESEVYCTDDGRYVVKVKGDESSPLPEALTAVQTMRSAADEFATVVGPEHSIPSYFLVAKNEWGQAQPVIVQPFYRNARPLFDLDYAALSVAERRRLAKKLVHIILRSLSAFFRTERMPDLYGRSSTSSRERKRLNEWYMFPVRLWSFVVKRNLLRSHNLMLSSPENGQGKSRIILVDYDPVRRSKLYQRIYYAVRLVLFVRDLALIGVMVATGFVPRA